MKNVVLGLLTLALVFACAPRSVEEYHTAENEEEIVRLMNQREYRKVIWLVESREGKSPANKRIAFLLGQSYLGAAGLEPLEVAAKVTEAQDFSGADAHDLFPACPSAAFAAGSDQDPLCLVKRVYFHVPDPDMNEMARARELFRYAYPDPAASPEWANVLVGAVETAAVIKRAGNIFLFAKRALKNGADQGQRPSDEQLRWFARQLKLILAEADQALQRADHSGDKISQLLTGSGGTVWFDRARGAITWAHRLGLANLFSFLRATMVSEQDETRYGEALDKIRAYLDEQDKRVAHVN